MTKFDEVMEQTRQVLNLMERHKAESAARALSDNEARVNGFEQRAVDAILKAIDYVEDAEKLLTEADEFTLTGQQNEGNVNVCRQIRQELAQIGDKVTDARKARAGEIVPEVLRDALFRVHALACRSRRESYMSMLVDADIPF